MSTAYIPEDPTQVPTTFVPQTDEPADPLDAIRSIESALEARPSSVDLVVAADEPPPLGRAWAFGWQDKRFLTAGSWSPLQTRGYDTLGGWIEKCLRTARGAHPVHPPGYGMPGGGPDLIGGPVGVVPADLEERIRDALTYHPRITDITNFDYDFDPNDDHLAVSFIVELDGGALELPVSNLQLMV